MFIDANMLILKVTRDCNLRCEYCYIENKDSYKNEKIDFETYKYIIEKLIKDKKKSILLEKPAERITLVVHGGEPTKIGYDLLYNIYSYASNRFIQENMEYSFGMQTNLTLIDQKMATMLGQFNVNVGASFDGIEESNHGRTKTHDTNFFEEKIKLLRDNSVQFGFLMVVSKSNIKNVFEGFKFLRDTYGIKQIKVNYAEDVTQPNIESEFETSGEEFFKYGWKPFIDEFLDKGEFYESNLKIVIEKFLTDFLAKTHSFKKSNCGLKICGGGINIIELDPDGSVHLCGRYSRTFEKAYVENVKDKDTFRLKQTAKYLEFAKDKHFFLKELGCDTCIADKICDHGCMAFHMSKFGEWGIRKDLVCPIFLNLHSYLYKNVDRLLDSYYNSYKNNEGYVVLSSSLSFHGVKRENFNGYKIEIIKEGELKISK